MPARATAMPKRALIFPSSRWTRLSASSRNLSRAGGGAGGGGGGANNQMEISQREKELIAATWKQQNDKTSTPEDQAVAGIFLSDAQQKLRDQAMALSARMRDPRSSAATEEFSGSTRTCRPRRKPWRRGRQVESQQWKDAMPLEQKALQALLRAEATFRKSRWHSAERGGGGGGGGRRRDLASLFDLELDTEKNQYETAQSSPPRSSTAKEIDDALQKLERWPNARRS